MGRNQGSCSHAYKPLPVQDILQLPEGIFVSPGAVGHQKQRRGLLSPEAFQPLGSNLRNPTAKGGYCHDSKILSGHIHRLNFPGKVNFRSRKGLPCTADNPFRSPGGAEINMVIHFYLSFLIGAPYS